ncbi:MAG: hypothetical protein AB7G34_09695, partial [Hyphomicrobiales bacterium]
MVRGIHAAQTWIHANEAATIARAISRYFPDLSETLLTASIKRYKSLGIWGQTPWLPEYGYNRLRSSLLSGGLVTYALPYNSAVDNSLAAEVLGMSS